MVKTEIQKLIMTVQSSSPGIVGILTGGFGFDQPTDSPDPPTATEFKPYGYFIFSDVETIDEDTSRESSENYQLEFSFYACNQGETTGNSIVDTLGDAMLSALMDAFRAGTLVWSTGRVISLSKGAGGGGPFQEDPKLADGNAVWRSILLVDVVIAVTR